MFSFPWHCQVFSLEGALHIYWPLLGVAYYSVCTLLWPLTIIVTCLLGVHISGVQVHVHFLKYTMCTRSNVTCGQSDDKILNEIFFKKLYFISFSLFLSPFNKELNTKRLQIPFFAMFFELSLEINVRYFVFSHIRRVTKTICHILKTIYQKGCPPLH